MKRGRPRSSWQALKHRGAKPSIWRKRKRESEGDPAVITWLEYVERVDKTFQSRCVTGEPICRDFHGQTFDWRPDHKLTAVRTLCERIVNDATYKWPDTKAQCAEFLEDLNTGGDRNIFVDPESVASISLFVQAFGKDTPIYWLTFFDLVRFFAQRTATGDYVLADSELLGFDQPIIAMLDKAVIARG